MVLVYEYTGAPFDVTRIYPILTPLNTRVGSRITDMFSASFLKIENVNNKTRLTIIVTRTDTFGPNRISWSEIFFINILLVTLI